jgi:hypothetical protein
MPKAFLNWNIFKLEYWNYILALLIPSLKTMDAWFSFKEQMQILWGK